MLNKIKLFLASERVKLIFKGCLSLIGVGLIVLYFYWIIKYDTNAFLTSDWINFTSSPFE